MEASERYQYYYALQNARRRYEEEKETLGHQEAYARFLGDAGYIALEMVTEGNAKAKISLTASKYAIKGAIETMAHLVSDPYHKETTHETFADEMIRHAKDRLNRDLQPLRDFFSKYLDIQF